MKEIKRRLSNEEIDERIVNLNSHYLEVCPDDAPFIIKRHNLGHNLAFEVINCYHENVIGPYSKLMKRNYVSAIPGPERRCAELKKYFEDMHETDEEITVKYHTKKNENAYLYDIYVSDVCWHRNMPYNALIKRTTLFKYDSNGNITYPRDYWTEERILNAMKSCKSSNPRTEFTDKFPGAVRPTYELDMFKRFAYIWNSNTKDGNKVYTKTQEWKVYLYSSEVNKSAYVGLTRNKLSRRDYSHRHMSKGKYDRVYRHYNGNIPKIQLLISGIKTKEDAQYFEDFYKNVFRHMGYYIINKAKTGIGTGSTGPSYPKVSDQNLIDTIPQNVKTLKELKVIDNKLANRISQRKLVEESGLVKYAYTTIYAFTIDGEYVGEFFSFERCAIELFNNKHLGQKIKRICDGGGDVNAITLKGYTFSYDRNGYINPKEKKKTKLGYRGQRVAQLKDWKIIRIESNAESYRIDGFDPHNIRAVCRNDKHSHKGYVWRYVNDNNEIISPEELKQNKKSEV